MHNCDQCGNSVDLPYSCNYCDLKLCSDHRLPENHDCVGLRQTYTIDSSDQTTEKERSLTEQQRKFKRVVQGAKEQNLEGSSHSSKPNSSSPASSSLSSRSKLIKSRDGKGSGVPFSLSPLVVLCILLVAAAGAGAMVFAPDAVPWSDMVEEVTSGDSSGAVTTSEQTEQPDQEDNSDVTSGLHAEQIEALVHQEINNVRRDHSLSQLNYDEGLEEIADHHSQDMEEGDYFAHSSPDGETMQDRYERFGYNCRVSTGGNRYATGGENIFKTSYSGYSFSEQEIAEKVVDGWMNSEGHRENILRGYWENEGIGVSAVESGGETSIHVTQNFC